MNNAAFSYPDLDDFVVNGSFDSFVPFNHEIFQANRETSGSSPTQVLITPISPVHPNSAESNQPEQPIFIEYLTTDDGKGLVELLSGICNENIHTEVDWGVRIGNEEW